jgi:hypothetical protein
VLVSHECNGIAEDSEVVGIRGIGEHGIGQGDGLKTD